MDQELNTASSLAEPLDLLMERVDLLAQVVFVGVIFYLLGQPSLALGITATADYKSELPVRVYTLSSCRPLNPLCEQMFYTDVFLQDQPASASLGLEQQFLYELPVCAFYFIIFHC